MSTPLTDSINALTRYANEVTGASDTTLSDAVATLASGYGGSSSEFTSEIVTVTTAQSNTLACAEEICETFDANCIYNISIMGKSKSDWVSNQFLGGLLGTTSSGDVQSSYGLRYRGSSITNCPVASNYDGRVEVGDQYLVFKTPYTE